jgi:hypothetical protein
MISAKTNARRGGATAIATRAAKRAAKTAVAPVLAGARAVGPFGLARGVVHADAFLRSGAPVGEVRGTETDLSEPARELRLLGAGDPPPAMTPVSTILTMLDASGGVLTFRDNHVADASRRIIFERAVDECGTPLAFKDLRLWRTPFESTRRVKGTVGYLSNAGVHNLGHWLLFLFPLVRYYRDYLGRDPDFYYLGKGASEFHYASLAEIGISPNRVLIDGVAGDRMLAAIVDNQIPPPTPFLDFSTTSLRLRPDRTKASRRIFVSRALRSTRTLLNELQCLKLLQDLGFESVRTEAMTFREARELFATAEIVVGVHGAGLANLLCCQPGTILVELFPHGFADSWFAEVCAAREITYSCLSGERVDVRGLRPMHFPVLIDLAKFEQVLDAAVNAANARAVPAREGWRDAV